MRCVTEDTSRVEISSENFGPLFEHVLFFQNVCGFCEVTDHRRDNKCCAFPRCHCWLFLTLGRVSRSEWPSKTDRRHAETCNGMQRHAEACRGMQHHATACNGMLSTMQRYTMPWIQAELSILQGEVASPGSADELSAPWYAVATEKACIVSNTPEPVKTHPQLNVGRFATFDALRVAAEDNMTS